MTLSDAGDFKSQLLKWQETLDPLKVDVVGDFAGKELFAIHGESLVAHCVEQANVDYENGFQLLHAIHAIEVFLANLKNRGCNFHVLWFDQYEHLSIPAGGQNHSHKYLLTRAVVIDQLKSTDISLQFTGLDSDEFVAYANLHSLHFVMCMESKPFTAGIEQSIDLLTVTFMLARNGYSIAYLDSVEFRSSKVYASITPSKKVPDISCPEPCAPKPVFDFSKLWEKLETLQENNEKSGPGEIVVIACSRILSEASSCSDEDQRRVAALLVHGTIIENGDITQRSCPLADDMVDDGSDCFLEKFSTIATYLIKTRPHSLETVVDLIDGRVFLQVLKNLDSLQLVADKEGKTANRRILETIERRMEAVKSISGVDVSKHLPASNERLSDSTKAEKQDPIEGPVKSTSVLPFSHPVMDKYLQDVQLKSDDTPEPIENSKIVQELTHWHNAKNPIDSKHVQKPLDWRTRRRNQRYMAETIAYSASLTNATGKNIDPEIIVAQKDSSNMDSKTKFCSTKDPKKPLNQRLADGLGKSTKEESKSGRQKSTEAGKAHQSKKESVKVGKSKEPPKSNKEKALDAAKARQNEKESSKSHAILTFWQERYQEFEKEASPSKRYYKATKYLASLKTTDKSIIGGEVSLYVCHVLGFIRKSVKDETTGMGLLALIWSTVQTMQQLPLTVDTHKQLEKLAMIVGYPLQLPREMSRPLVPAARRLPFDPSFDRYAVFLKSPMSAQDFQLEHCGPYLERGFDSAADARVPFHPDAWQRKVLDAIDEDKSLFVVAPTSAGKTFISFYAMKKVLHASDEDVIVYVAPTKALVNQIAAEIQARFAKSYGHQEGKSVWAIHTRDYRINNPSGCQVLVTVPHILQIMLLAPSNAQKPNSWSRRVKRIIFDEVHSIGQAEDGIIWEQLLLLAPCPIIALSATVGNPLEFKEWLAGTQQAKGFDLEMVVHTARYSDLRKYFYLPSNAANFKGLVPIENLPIPGLEASPGARARFIPVHPVGAIENKDPAALNDIGLEPRDCLLLWKTMVKYENASYRVNPDLTPEKRLPTLLKKSNVLDWEAGLKEQLKAWMMDRKSPFEDIRKELQTIFSRRLGVPKDEAESSDGSISNDGDSAVLSLLVDLRSNGALPALLFNYDRVGCETALLSVLERLQEAEQEHRGESSEWIKTMEEYTKWTKAESKRQEAASKVSGKNRDKDGSGMTKTDLAIEAASHETSPWATFDPDAPLPAFSFGDHTKITNSELEETMHSLKWCQIKPHFIEGLRRGLGVHHAGMNRQYRQVVEILFRKGYLTCVIATGTLALGINMPCKTVVFFGDSVYLTTLNYRQGSGRAGRRGFDSLGNVVFYDIEPHRAMSIMSSRLPDLGGQFPTSVTLILRLFGLLNGTNNSEYASKAVDSLLTQTRLYLGGPSSEMTIKHHLRFSIEYLQRQALLSPGGVPLNFSGLVGHLYFTENSAFAFHSLLKSGYFHELCADISSKPKDVLLSIMLVLCHIFCRIPCPKYKNKEWLEAIVHRSPSIVLLPRLPEKAEKVLHAHNKETLDIFESYVRTYVGQHLASCPDNKLPFTDGNVSSNERIDMSQMGISLNDPTTVRSPFAALSGFTDEFETIHELCSTVRDGVFLEESSIPYIPVYPKETQGVPFNAYIYDFYKHGDMTALVRDNGIKGGDVWFHLKDFSLVLATIVTSLANFLDPSAENDDAAMIDIRDAGDILEEGFIQADDAAGEGVPSEEMKPVQPETAKPVKAKNKKKVLDSWDEEEDSDDEESVEDSSTETSGIRPGDKESLLNVFKAFTLLRQEFDDKFRKVWA